jgi:hypothetical protein
MPAHIDRGPDKAPLDHLRELMAQSLVAWRLAGNVRGASNGAVLVSCGRHDIRIEPAPPNLPFRWVVIIDERRRSAISLVAVLRQVRSALDPGYATMRARIAAVPLVQT